MSAVNRPPFSLDVGWDRKGDVGGHDRFPAGWAIDDELAAEGHDPVGEALEGPLIQQALDTTREFPSVTPPPLPDQSVLDQIILALSQPVS